MTALFSTSRQSSPRWTSGWFASTLLLLLVRYSDAQMDHFTFRTCSICPIGQVVTLPDVVIPAGTSGITQDNSTCAELDALAMGGSYSPAACALLRNSIKDDCGCMKATPEPVPPPTTVAPVAPTTPAPVDPMTPAPSNTTTTPPPTDPPPAFVCYICGVNETVGNSSAILDIPDGIVDPDFGAADFTCGMLDDLAMMGAFGEMQCSILQGNMTLQETCQCSGMDMPTAAPVVPPTPMPVTAAPVGNTTTAPTVAPVTTAPSMAPVANTTAPTPVPVTLAPTTASPVTLAPVAPTPVNTTVTVNLEDLVAELDQEQQAAYEQACATFLASQLGLQDVTCTILGQEVLTGSRLRRALQDSGLTVETSVTATSSAPIEDSAIADALNSPAFEEELVAIGILPPPPTAPPQPPSPTPPVEDSDDSLGGGAIFGVVVAVAFGLALIIGGGYYLSKQSSGARAANVPDPTEIAPASPRPKVGAGAGRPVETPNVAALATISALSAGSSIASGSRDASNSVMTGTEMEGYSLAGEDTTARKTQGTGESGAEGTSASGDEMSSHAMSSLKQNMISRTVVAPPGKLGIVIDTTLEGPVVHKVNPQSPLEGTLFPGDIIVAIDDVDTRAMSASAITALMVRTANLRRKLTVLSEDVTN